MSQFSGRKGKNKVEEEIRGQRSMCVIQGMHNHAHWPHEAPSCSQFETQSLPIGTGFHLISIASKFPKRGVG